MGLIRGGEQPRIKNMNLDTTMNRTADELGHCGTIRDAGAASVEEL